MATIVRCHHCLTPVYRSAVHCHHCGEDLSKRKRRLFTKRSVLFLAGAVTIFAAGDAIWLTQTKRNSFARDESVLTYYLTHLISDPPRAKMYWATPEDPSTDYQAEVQVLRTLAATTKSKAAVISFYAKEKAFIHPRSAPERSLGVSDQDAIRYRFTATSRQGKGQSITFSGHVCLIPGRHRGRVLCLELDPVTSPPPIADDDSK